MGANNIPITKNIGRTVLGVRIGLIVMSQLNDAIMFQTVVPTAMLSTVVVEKQYLTVKRKPLALKLIYAGWNESWSYLRASCFSVSFVLHDLHLGYSWCPNELAELATSC